MLGATTTAATAAVAPWQHAAWGWGAGPLQALPGCSASSGGALCRHYAKHAKGGKGGGGGGGKKGGGGGGGAAAAAAEDDAGGDDADGPGYDPSEFER